VNINQCSDSHWEFPTVSLTFQVTPRNGGLFFLYFADISEVFCNITVGPEREN